LLHRRELRDRCISREKDLPTERRHREEPFATKRSSFLCGAKLDGFAQEGSQ